ncbi:MAG TPA: hypothetical protein VIE88_01595, partial [Vicinamibacteria bacterium]
MREASASGTSSSRYGMYPGAPTARVARAHLVGPEVFFLRRVAVSLASFAACLVGGCDLASTTECAPDLVFGLQVTGNERQGAPERPGIYTLTVTAPGFVTKT